MTATQAPAPKTIEDADVVLNLEIAVLAEHRAEFLEFCRKAFPVYESVGGAKFALYEDEARPGRFSEVGYYRTMADYQRGEKAVQEDPAQVALIKEWRALLEGQPRVAIMVRKRP